MRTFYFILFLFFLQTPAHAEMYQWVDEQGQKHFTDYPPPEKTPKDSDIPVESLEPKGNKPPPLLETLSEQDKKQLNDFGEAMGKALGSLGEALGKALAEGLEQSFIQENPINSTRDNSDACKKIAATYVEENNSKNRNKWTTRLHPKVRACIPGQSAYFDYYFSKNKAIPSDYKATCEKRNPADPLPFEKLLAQKMTYPARPNYRIILDYKTGPTAFKTDIIEVFEEQSKWHTLIPCLTEAGLKEFTERKQ